MNTIKIISLGCSKNTVDSEVLMGNLRTNHWTLIDAEDIKNPDVLLINTCGFIGDAKQESIDYILHGVNLKMMGKIKKMYVMGCLSQRHGEDLSKEIEGVDQWFGVHQMEEVLQTILTENKEIKILDRFLTTPKHYAYLKIAEGCDRKCAFCAIPLIRGPHISRTKEEILEETVQLVAGGVKEIILIEQDLTYYGIDLYQQRALTDLIKAMAKIEGLEWIRLQYLYPHGFPEDLVELLKNEPKLCKYIDIPLQHISTDVLHSMKRATTKEESMSLMKHLREQLPNAAFRTTLIVGYPNETETDFEDLKQFVKDFRFERLGVFTYSPEEGTAAYVLGDTIADEEKQRRADEIMEIQEAISLSINETKIGKEYRVLIDREEGDYYIGRTEFDSPEVDNEVLIAIEDGDLELGEFYQVRITEAEPHDLYAQVLA